jgi:hypothetical protein
MKFRPQFRLRTVFVLLTLLAIWLAYALPWIKERHAFLTKADLFFEFNDTPPTILNKNRLLGSVPAPWSLFLLGERGVVSVWLPPTVWSPELQAEAVRLFPEAVILKVNANGMWDVRK